MSGENWDGAERRQLSELSILRADIHSIKSSMEKLAEAVTRLAVLEEKHMTHSAAIERAFSAIERVQTAQEAHEAADERKHSALDKKTAFAQGVVMAVSAIWTIFGGYMLTQLNEYRSFTEQVRVHLIEDKVKSMQDVRTAVKEELSK